jgi:predicted metal-dependent HD superfamily phosphohydrolase
MTPWTRVPKSVWGMVIYGGYDLHYHNTDHLRRMYIAADALSIPYCINLDIAILYHDIVYDVEGNNELRSIEKLRQDWPMIFAACGEFTDLNFLEISHLIQTTRYDKWRSFNPKPGYKPDNRLVVLDLYDFSNVPQLIENYSNLMRESMEMYGCSEIEFAEANGRIMSELWRQLPKFMDYAPIWHEIGNGILLTTQISQAVKIKL